MKNLPPDILSNLRSCVYGITGEHETPEAMLADVKRFEDEGVHGVCLHFSSLREEFWTLDTFRKIIDSVHVSTYVSMYRKHLMDVLSDDERADMFRLAAEAGADIVDIMGDFYHPTPGELSTDSESVAKQAALMNDIRARGAKALMSSHILAYRSCEETLAVFRAHKERGADISKAVFRCDTGAELNESLKTTVLLRQTLGIPFVHLCGGPLGHDVQRYQTLLLGGCMSFVQHGANETQPTVKELLDFLRPFGA